MELNAWCYRVDQTGQQVHHALDDAVQLYNGIVVAAISSIINHQHAARTAQRYKYEYSNTMLMFVHDTRKDEE